MVLNLFERKRKIMTVEEKIKTDDNWKELIKNMVDKCDNLNEFQKEIMKFCLEMQNEENKNKKRIVYCI